MEKKRPWFSDRYNEKHISLLFRYLGYGAIICSFFLFWTATDKEMDIAERMYYFLFAPYLLIMGIGIRLRKDWGRKLVQAFPLNVLVVTFMFLIVIGEMLPIKDISDLYNLIIPVLIWGIIFIVIYLTWVKYYNHPNVKKYFNR